MSGPKAEKIRLHTKNQFSLDNFDYVIIGAGSGGISTARRAASHGAKVAMISAGPVGGVCPNLGCVPKKVTWSSAGLGEEMAHGESFGFDQLDKDPTTRQFNWPLFKTKRDKYIRYLNGVYCRNLLKDGITLIRGRADFVLSADGEPDLSKFTVTSVPRNDFDCSDDYFDDFNLEDFKGKEVFVDPDFPLKFTLNPQYPKPASYIGSQVLSGANAAPLSATTNFLTVSTGSSPIFPDIEIIPATDADPSVPISQLKRSILSSSDDFFGWAKQPRRICTTGGGYIGVELSQLLSVLGTKVSYVIRGDAVLKNFDETLTCALQTLLDKQCTMVKHASIAKIAQLSKEEISSKALHGQRSMNEDEVRDLFSPKHCVTDTNTTPDQVYAVWTQSDCKKDGQHDFLGYFDRVLFAIGRSPVSTILNIPTSVVNTFGYIKINEMGDIDDEKAKNMFSVGDVVGKVNLTPVAISFGRRLSDWLFGGKNDPLIWHDRKTDKGLAIPTVVFSHPPVGTCGLSEHEAELCYGKDKIRVWNAQFVPMYCALMKPEEKFQAVTKMITVKEFCSYTQQEEDIVVGIHLMFPGASEAMQGFAIAVANRLPKSFIDNTTAIHPSASEELVLFR